MTFDQTVLIWCLAVPAAIAAGGCLVSSWLRRRDVSQTCGAIVVTTSWWLAIVVSMIGLQGWRWWPDEAWRQAVWPILAWVLWSGMTAFADRAGEGRWVVAGCLAILTGMMAMPSGEGWQDALPLHRLWLPAIAISCLANTFALAQLARHGGHRWCLMVALAALGGPMALAASTYGSLAQWCLGIVVATGVIAIAGVGSSFEAGRWPVSIPAIVAASGIAAAARFYTYESHPRWIYGLMLMTPALIVVLDLPFRHSNRGWRVVLSGTIAMLIVALCVWQFLLGVSAGDY